MKRLFLIISVLAIIWGGSFLSYAGFDEDFEEATDIGMYRSGLKDIETALLIKNATGVLHDENMKILEKLMKIEQRLSILEKMIEQSR